METEEKIIEKEVKTLPLMALRGKVLLPTTILNFDVGRAQSVEAINRAQDYGGLIVITAQTNVFIDNPRKSDLEKIGVVARVKQVLKIAGGNMKVSVHALYRVNINKFLETTPCFMVEAEKIDYIPGDPIITETYFRLAKRKFFDYAMADKRIAREMLITINEYKEPNDFMDNALSVVHVKSEDVQSILNISDTADRLVAFVDLIDREIEINKIEKQISSRVKNNIDKSQKEFYLREQLKAIHTELGDDEDEKQELINQIKAKKLPEDVEKKALKEIARLDKINPSSPDYSIILNYIDWLKEVPFNELTEDTADLRVAKFILDADHFGLEKVKQRIVEHLAVLSLTKEIKGPILCFVGPPGVGKTSVATSIARALNRKFVRMSLGGVKDEAEIRGHRRTYVGAMPGRIIFGLKNAGSANPVFLLDEIDKLSSDIHGDPASALLEVLDPEQNTSFRDRFMEIPYDLSKVMFITTANTTETIPAPLLDRMEVIELSGYTNEEKLQIAKQYLIPKQLKACGLTDKKVEFTDDAIIEIIEGYTMEAGVRVLEREISSVIRKIACKVAENKRLRKQIVTKDKVFNYLGVRKRLQEELAKNDEVGTATGLAWTRVGGATLSIEVGLMQGKGEILLTGKLGDVMKESARTAISYIRANAGKYGIDKDVFEKTDIHVHVPEGATPKDGPSAGITIATAILSAFTGKSVKGSVAMTGEITLRGRVLPIGGLKEKSLAAFRQGIKTIIIPKGNSKDVSEIPEEIRKEIKFILADTVATVFETAINL